MALNNIVFIFQANIASDRITVPLRLVEMVLSVARSRTVINARVHLASRDQIARTTSMSATEARADMVPAKILTDLISK